jgi:RHS repeat-associated protein
MCRPVLQVTSTELKAFVTILFFDKDYNLLDAAWDQIGSAGAQTSGTVKQPPHDVLSVTAKAPEAGYAYIFLSNEDPNYVDVYFDDVNVSQTPSPIFSVSDYYPFGLTYNSYQRENSTSQKFLYNGKENINDLALNWDDYGARMYMPEIGRWGVIDPLAASMPYTSAYNYVKNNPISYIDYQGKFPIPVIYLVYEGFAYAFTATAAMYVVTHHDDLVSGLYFGGESAVLEARGKSKSPYWARYVFKNNRGAALDYGQPRAATWNPTLKYQTVKWAGILDLQHLDFFR